jgi:hypothetical protein
MYPYNKCNPEVICKFACSSKPGRVMLPPLDHKCLFLMEYRPTTSEKNVVDVRNPRRIANIKVRKTKSYNMWNEIWDKLADMYLQ